jgi:hypothetical protein
VGANPILPSGGISVAGTVRSRTANTVVLPATYAGFGDLYVGLGVRGTGIAAGARIAAVNAATRTLTLTAGGVSANGTGTLEFGNFVATTRLARSIVLPLGVAMENLFLGQAVSGTGIAAGTRITAIDPATRTITLSADMTATGTAAVSFAAPARNLIQFNREGMVLALGTNVVTNAEVSNSTFDGVRITGGAQTLGTSTSRSATSNAIYANGRYGVNVVVTPANPAANHLIRGNFIGMQVNGTTSRPNVTGPINPARVVNPTTQLDADGNQYAPVSRSGGTSTGARPPSTIFPLR